MEEFGSNPGILTKLLEGIGLFSLMKPMIGKPKVGTYVYRGKDYFYDQIIVNNELQDAQNLSIVDKSIYILDLPKYRQQEGNYKHFPFRFNLLFPLHEFLSLLLQLHFCS